MSGSVQCVGCGREASISACALTKAMDDRPGALRMWRYFVSDCRCMWISHDA